MLGAVSVTIINDTVFHAAVHDWGGLEHEEEQRLCPPENHIVVGSHRVKWTESGAVTEIIGTIISLHKNSLRNKMWGPRQ